jgi:hypothetical protein
VYLEVVTGLEPFSASKEATFGLLEKEFDDFNSRFVNMRKKAGM